MHAKLLRTTEYSLPGCCSMHVIFITSLPKISKICGKLMKNFLLLMRWKMDSIIRLRELIFIDYFSTTSNNFTLFKNKC